MMRGCGIMFPTSTNFRVKKKKAKLPNMTPQHRRGSTAAPVMAGGDRFFPGRPHADGQGHRMNQLVLKQKIPESRLPTQAMKTTTEKPISIEAAAAALKFDRRTIRLAIKSAVKIDHFEPVAVSPQGHPLFMLADFCEAMELHHIRLAPPDLRRSCPRMEADHERALALPCPRCNRHHQEAPILPMPGRTYPPELAAWFKEHGFPTRYEEAGPDHDF